MGGGFRMGMGCPMHPRCRWRIGAGEVKLQPYRLLVGIVENRRVEGKVRQEIVADLGAIDGYLLPGFYAGLDPIIAENEMGSLHWRCASLYARAAFWQALHEKLSRLANRIDAQTAAALMAAIHSRIPMLRDGEMQSIDREIVIHNAQNNLNYAESLIDGNEKELADLEEWKLTLQQKGQKLRQLQQQGQQYSQLTEQEVRDMVGAQTGMLEQLSGVSDTLERVRARQS
jgi:hypothetical protein